MRGRIVSTRLKRITSTLLFGCWLWALALAAAPELHEWLHGEEAGHDDHDCVVRLLATGGVDAPDLAPVLAVAPVDFVSVAMTLPNCDVASVFLVSGTLEHGPPARRA